MKLYDFSAYAKIRSVRKAEESVALAASQLTHPGSVLELKQRVNEWFKLHREVIESRTKFTDAA